LFPAPANGVWGLLTTVEKPQSAALRIGTSLFGRPRGRKHEGRWGFINKSGAEVIPFQYRLVQSFHGGVAIVDTGLPEHPIGVIDPSGAVGYPAYVFEVCRRRMGREDSCSDKGSGRRLSFYDRSGNLVLGPYSLAFSLR